VGSLVRALIVVVEEEIDIALCNISDVDTQVHDHLYLGVPGDISSAGNQLVDEIPTIADITTENPDDRGQIEGEANVHVLGIEVVGKKLDPLDVDLDYCLFGIGRVQREAKGVGIGKAERLLNQVLHFLKHG